jgi:hypothetical protein
MEANQFSLLNGSLDKALAVDDSGDHDVLTL